MTSCPPPRHKQHVPPPLSFSFFSISYSPQPSVVRSLASLPPSLTCIKICATLDQSKRGQRVLLDLPSLGFSRETDFHTQTKLRDILTRLSEMIVQLIILPLSHK